MIPFTLFVFAFCVILPLWLYVILTHHEKEIFWGVIFAFEMTLIGIGVWYTFMTSPENQDEDDGS